ncbi:hypothetical protein J6590_103887 [Homalodisca vitripennis]|nr:hypothetical protein J6590_103887 [Homalodisca vitripennis]
MYIEKRIPGLSTKYWKLIHIKKERDRQILLFLGDDLPVQDLKERCWRGFIGMTRVQIRMLGGPDEETKG